VPAIPSDSWRVILRYTARLAGAAAPDGAPTTQRVWASLTVQDAAFAPFVRFYTVNNDTGDVAAHALLATGEQSLAANANGYSFLATCRNSQAALPAMQWKLTVVSDAPLTPLTPTPAALKGQCRCSVCVCARARAFAFFGLAVCVCVCS
jgi:hypothetical protein